VVLVSTHTLFSLFFLLTQTHPFQLFSYNFDQSNTYKDRQRRRRRRDDSSDSDKDNFDDESTRLSSSDEDNGPSDSRFDNGGSSEEDEDPQQPHDSPPKRPTIGGKEPRYPVGQFASTLHQKRAQRENDTMAKKDSTRDERMRKRDRRNSDGGDEPDSSEFVVACLMYFAHISS